MDDFLKKELEKNKKYNDLIYKQLEQEKKTFIRKIRSDLGDKIFLNFKESKKKVSFWEKIKKIFN